MAIREIAMSKAFINQVQRMVVGFLLGSVAGCGAPTVASGVPGLLQLDAVTVIGTDKTIVDHVISYASGRDCSSIYVEKGDRYCKEDEPVIKPQVYCYRTLGRATCYETPDPYANGQRENGNNDHNLVTSHKGKTLPR